MALYCGIDLHANNSVVSVLDDRDKVVFEKRLPNELAVIGEALAPFRAQLAGSVVESTYNWYWLVDGLMEAGFCVHLANTAAVRQYEGIKHTDDHSDARHLAHLLRLGILPEGHIYPREQRMVRDLLRRRLLLVQQKTAQHVSLQGLIARHTGKRLSANAIKRLDTERLAELLDEPVVLGAQIAWRAMQWHERAITMLEEAVLKGLRDQPAHRLLQSIPGVGRVLGMSIALETGDIGRFPNAGHYASYARCVKSEKLSNGKRKGEGNRKNGNRYLAWAFMEAAHFAAIWEPTIKRYYQRKAARSHVLVAKKAVAHKLARAVYHMLSRQERFVLHRAFG